MPFPAPWPARYRFEALRPSCKLTTAIATHRAGCRVLTPAPPIGSAQYPTEANGTALRRASAPDTSAPPRGPTLTPPEKPSRTVQEIIDAIWQNRDRPYNVRCLVKRLQRIDKAMSGETRELFASFIPQGDVARFARELPGKIANDFSAAMRLLRNNGARHRDGAPRVNQPPYARTSRANRSRSDDEKGKWRFCRERNGPGCLGLRAEASHRSTAARRLTRHGVFGGLQARRCSIAHEEDSRWRIRGAQSKKAH